MRFLMLVFTLAVITIPAAGANRVITSVGDLSTAISNLNFGARFDLAATVLTNGRIPQGIILAEGNGTVVDFYDHSTNDLSGIRPGDRVRVIGTLNPGKVTDIAADFDGITVLSHGSIPQPFPTSIHALRQDRNCAPFRFVSVEGTVMDAFPDEIDEAWVYLTLKENAETLFLAARLHGQRCELGRFIGKRVRATGVYTRTAGSRQMLGWFVVLDSLEFLQILGEDANSQQDIGDINDYTYFSRNDTSDQFRRFTTGTVIATWGGNKLLLREPSGRIIRGELNGSHLPEYGTSIRLLGFPETDLYSMILVRADWTELPNRIHQEDKARIVSARQIQTVKQGALRYDFSLHGKVVRIKGTVCGMPIRNGHGMLHVENDGQIVPVDVSSVPNAVRNIDVGFVVEVSGTCVMETEKMSLNRTFPRINGYRIVMRSPDDIRIVARPPWWTPGRLLAALGILGALIVGFVIWNLVLRRAVNRRGRELEAEITARIGSELKVYERTRLAVELHDSIAQNLTGATMEIRTADILADSDPAAMHKYLSLAGKTLDSCREDLRNCIWDLRNLALDEDSADEAIRRTLAPHLGDATLAVRFAVSRERLSDNTAHTILRIIRELALNAIRHGGATHIGIAGSIEGDRMLFSVKDNGRGFDQMSAPGMSEGHFGLQGIRDRVKSFDGTVEIASAIGKGTKVTVALKLPPSSEMENDT